MKIKCYECPPEFLPYRIITPRPQQQMRISKARETPTLLRHCYSPVCRCLSVCSPATNPAGDDATIHLADKLSVATQFRNTAR